MAVIAGLKSFPSGRAALLCEQMLIELSDYANGVSRIIDLEGVTLAAKVQNKLPEDLYDIQPYKLPNGDVVVADIRIDNRYELTRALELDVHDVARRSDAWLFSQCWLRWAEQCFRFLVADYAVAMWVDGKRELVLARSILGARPLFYVQDGTKVAFASLPSALAVIADLNVQVDEIALAADVVRVRRPLGETIYRNVRSVEPGMLLRFRESSMARRQTWAPDLEPLRMSAEEAGEGLRHVFSLAVESRLRSAQPVVATQLSAGRDSSAVTIVAAEFLKVEGRKLIALTGAPDLAVELAPYKDEIFDESPIAALTLASFPEVEHRVSRRTSAIDAELFTAIVALNQFPTTTASNLPWQIAVCDDASCAGADVLLNGGFGNATVSGGGRQFLPDLLSEDGLLSWLPEVWRSAPFRPMKLIRSSARSLVPARLYRKMTSRGTRGFLAQCLLTDECSAEIKQRYGDMPNVALRSAREELAAEIAELESPDMLTFPFWGLDARDPTADRRVVEYCLRLPAHVLIGPGRERPAYASAFGARLPPSVTKALARGYQGADYFKHFDPTLIQKTLDSVAATKFGDLLKKREISALLARWPRKHRMDFDDYEVFRIGLLGLFSAATLINCGRIRRFVA